MFKRAFVRGIQSTLVANDRAVYPDEKIAAEVADYIADSLDFDPLSDTMTYDKVAELANHLIDASNELLKQGHKADPSVKTASLKDLTKLAHENAIALMQKAAEGTTLDPGNQGNKEETSAEGKNDKAYRPDGYAENSRGTTEIDTKPGEVGAMKDHPTGPANSPAGSNSLTEGKSASLTETLRKMAQGTTLSPGNDGNKSSVTAEGQDELKARPQSYAVLPSQGAPSVVNNLVSGSAIAGREIPHPDGPTNKGVGASTNSLIQHSAKAASYDEMFIELFKKTANEVVNHLPTSLSQEQKVAEVRKCMGLNTEEKAGHILNLYKVAGDAPPWLTEKKDEKKEGKCSKCDADPCKCEKKEASADLLAVIRNASK